MLISAYVISAPNWVRFLVISRPHIKSCASFDDVIHQADYVWKCVLEGASEELTAMSHVAERVKACASEICTTDSNGDGLAQLIEQRILNEKNPAASRGKVSN